MGGLIPAKAFASEIIMRDPPAAARADEVERDGMRPVLPRVPIAARAGPTPGIAATAGPATFMIGETTWLTVETASEKKSPMSSKKLISAGPCSWHESAAGRKLLHESPEYYFRKSVGGSPAWPGDRRARVKSEIYHKCSPIHSRSLSATSPFRSDWPLFPFLELFLHTPPNVAERPRARIRSRKSRKDFQLLKISAKSPLNDLFPSSKCQLQSLRSPNTPLKPLDHPK